MKYFIMAMVGAILINTSCSNTPEADLVLLHGKIVTVDKNFSLAEGVAVKNGRILFVGANEDCKNFIGKTTQVIDLKGKLTLPGLIDAHGHLASYGSSLEILDLNNAESFEEIVHKVAERVKSSKPGEWILGRGWDQNNWKNNSFPLHDALSSVSPENPVYLSRTCGHAAIVNQKTLDIVGIHAQTPNPEGGKIIREANGRATGVLVDNALELVWPKIPMVTEDQLGSQLENASKNCLAKGLTGMHDAGVPVSQLNVYKKLIDEDRLYIRVYAMLETPKPDHIEASLRDNRMDNYKDFLCVRSVKLFADGSLGSRGAAMIGPYSDDPANYGLIINDKDFIYKVAKTALKLNMQVNVHAIGDHANRLSLDGFEMALKEFPEINHRFRIEHAQVVALSDIPRFNQLGVIPSMQPTSAVSDMPWALDRIGAERAKGTYCWRKFIDSGCIIPLSSDFPVETNNPMIGIYSAITCANSEGFPENGWFPEEKLTIEEAIKGFTIWAAYASFQENEVGSIEVGKFADFTVLNKDILTVPPKEIISTKPVYTIVGGKIMYQQIMD